MLIRKPRDVLLKQSSPTLYSVTCNFSPLQINPWLCQSDCEQQPRCAVDNSRDLCCQSASRFRGSWQSASPRHVQLAAQLAMRTGTRAAEQQWQQQKLPRVAQSQAPEAAACDSAPRPQSAEPAT